MTIWTILFLTISALFTSSLTAVMGAGGGTALIAIMLLVVNPVAAIPVHGAVQLAANTTSVWLFWRHMSWPIILRFSALLPLGVYIGLKLFQGLPTEAVQLLIGVFVLLSLVTGAIKRWRQSEVPLWAFVPIGFITGILNMVVGSSHRCWARSSFAKT